MFRWALIMILAALAAPASLGADATASPGDTVTLVDGRTIVAPIIKETSEALWLDLGHDLIRLPRTQIEAIERSARDEDGPGDEAAPETLFRTARGLPERSPREQARRFGEAVIKVSTPAGLGSGFIIHPDGYAITNAHVIQGERKIKATVYEEGELEFRRRIIDDVEIIAVNNHLDLALIRIEHPEGDPFPHVYLQATERLEAGQEVFAIGAPLGLERTLSSGVIATTQRSFEGVTYIQTTTQINPGNSGGPLFNARGEVIGVTNMKIPFGEGLGFAIPMRYVRDFVRNREAFAFDRDNPNSGYSYAEPPPRFEFTPPPILDDKTSDPRP